MVDEVEFKAKVTNMFVQTLTAIMKNDLGDASHFLREPAKEYAMNLINKEISSNRRKMYDELNVSNIQIQNTEENDDNIIYSISLDAKYLDYELDLATGDIVSGSDQRRVDKRYHLRIILNKNVKEFDSKCPGCGKSLDVNYSGKCSYCGAIFHQEDYGYQILDIIS